MLPTLAVAVAAFGLDAAAALERCRAKVDKKTGVIRVYASSIDAGGTLLWGPELGLETNAFFNAASCISSGKARKCELGDPATLDAKTPPSGCTIFLADGVSASCSAWVAGCTPGARTSGGATSNHAVDIESFYDPSDGGDWAPALRRAIDSFTAGAHPSVGGKILLGPKTYELASSVDIDREIVLEGAGGPGWFSPSVLLFAAGVDGIVVHSPETSPANPDPLRRGAWSVIRNLSVQSQGGAGAVPEVHGIVMKARAAVENVYVKGFSGNGIRIDADVNDVPPTNANNWRIDTVRIDGCGSHGLFVDGGDTNAGTATAVDSSSNGGWGIYDSSFLGNTYVGAHTAANAMGSYKSDNPNARNLFVNCYAESGQSPAEIASPAMVIGGLLDLAPDVTTALRPAGEELQARNSISAANNAGPVAVIGRLGSLNTDNVALEFVHEDESSWPWRLEFDESDSWWKLRWANTSAHVALALSVDATAEGRGQLWLPAGAWLGAAASKVQVQAASIGGTRGVEVTLGLGGSKHFMTWAAAPPGTSGFAAGDIVWNSGASPVAGWRFDGASWVSF
jgi:hypothetical protein